MSDQNVPRPYILLKQLLGERKPNQEGEEPLYSILSRGEILLEIPQKEQILRKDGTPAHNYCKYNNPDITLYNSGTNVSPLHVAELDYLLSIKRPSVRAVEYLQADKMAWIMDLRYGTEVFFKLNKEKSLIIQGKIRYYGAIPGHTYYDGVMFGIEIIDKEHRGKGTTDGYPHFQCGDRNAVYVTMEKIIMSKNKERNNQPGLTKEGPPALNTRTRTSNKPSEEGKKKGKGILENAKAFITGPPIVTPVSTSHVDSQFSEGDRVVVQTVREKVITGIVRWVGPVKTSKEDGGIVVPVVGIETDKKIDVDKEFPYLHYELFQHQFPITSNHSRVYLPEQLVLHIDEYTKQKQENNTREVQEVQKWGLSVEEYRAQNKMLSKSNEEKNKDHENRPIIPDIADNQQNDEEKLAGGGSDDSFLPMGPGDSVREILGKDKVQLQREEYEGIQREHKRKHSLEDSMYEIEIQDQPVSLPYHPVHQNVPHLGSPSLQKIPDSSQTSPHSQHQDGNLDQISSGLVIGSMVQMTPRGGAPIRGVIKWIGIVPNYQGHVAGVELDIPMEGCTDGSWNGKQYFICPSGRALFCPLRSLEQDTRYMEPHQVPAARRQELKYPMLSKQDKVIKRQQQDVSSSTEKAPQVIEENTKLQLLLQQKEIENVKFQENIHLLKTEKDEVARQLADLKITHTRIEAEKYQLTNEIAVLRVDNDSLKQTNREKEHFLANNEQLQRQLTDLYRSSSQEKYQLTNEIAVLRVDNDSLKQTNREKEHLLANNEQLQRQLTDLYRSSSQEKDQLTNEIAVLREQVRKKEQSNITDIKYWEVSHTDVKSTGVKLGDGGWGTVEVGFFHGQKVALKMLHSDIVSPFYNDLVRREIAMMVKVRHPNLLLCIAAVLDHPSGSPIIITEVMDASLRNMYTSGKLDYKMKLSILRDVASALNYLHCHQDEIIHRDVSSANVLLEVKRENEWKAKLSDFGSANLSRLSKTTAPGAEVYSAPEVPREQTTKMDVYSYGILLCELLTNQFPLREAFPSMLQILANNWRLMHQLVLICTKDSPKDRPNMSYILQILYEKYPNILN